MRVYKDVAVNASAGEQSTRDELGDEAEAEIVELTPHADDADRHPKLRPIPKGDANGETVLVIPRLVVVAMEEEPKSDARTAARRQKGALAGAATLWCTRAALTAPSWQPQIASLAAATASHFTTLDGQTSSTLQGELGVWDATGLQAGRTEYHATTGGLATGDSTMSVRDMLTGRAPAPKPLVTRLLKRAANTQFITTNGLTPHDH